MPPPVIEVPKPHTLKTDSVTRSINLDIPDTAAERIEAMKKNWDPALEIFVFKYKRGHSIIEHNIQSESLKAAVSLCEEVCRKRKWTLIIVTPFIRDISRLLDPTYDSAL